MTVYAHFLEEAKQDIPGAQARTQPPLTIKLTIKPKNAAPPYELTVPGSRTVLHSFNPTPNPEPPIPKMKPRQPKPQSPKPVHLHRCNPPN